MDESTEKILNELAKAEFIKELQNKGISFTDALRELARRMRLLQGKTK
jgi:Mn-dependent DtxR family transcriptional regulator